MQVFENANYLIIFLFIVIIAFLWSFKPLPPSSKYYSFKDYLLEPAPGLLSYARNWGYFLYPFMYLLLGGDPIRNIKEMPGLGWLIIILIEVIIVLLLYWHYKKRKKRKH